MIEQDTIRLLRECDAGVAMGVASIDDVLPYVKNEQLKKRLADCRSAHVQLQHEIGEALNRFHDAGKQPGVMLRGMSMLKTKAEITVKPTDATIASLMTDGCGMGVKSLNKYLNEFEAADEAAKDVAKKLIHLEEQLISQVRDYL